MILQQHSRQKGAALFISLMFLIILTLIGLSAANVGIMQERMAGNVKQSNIAFQRAEAGLRAIEQRVKQIADGGDGGLGAIPIWSETLETLDIDLRGDCTLKSRRNDLQWQPSPDVTGTEYSIVQLSGATASGEVFGSACRPMQSEDAGNPGQSAVYYLIASKAPGDDGLTEADVQ